MSRQARRAKEERERPTEEGRPRRAEEQPGFNGV